MCFSQKGRAGRRWDEFIPKRPFLRPTVFFLRGSRNVHTKAPITFFAQRLFLFSSFPDILSASIRECHDDAVMSASHSFSCYTDFTLKDELRHSAVMKLLLRGKNYSENMSTQNNLSSGVEPPLDLSYSTGLVSACG